MTSLLYSAYIIDGVPQEVTPAQMLDECLSEPPRVAQDASMDWDTIADETIDPAPRSSDYDSWRVQEYLGMLRDAGTATLPVPFAAQYTKMLIAGALARTMLRRGSFRLRDLAVRLHWRWNGGEVGHAAAFFASAEAASEYIDGLGLRIDSYSCETSEVCDLEVSVCLDSDAGEHMPDGMFRSASPELSDRPACPDTLAGDPDSWIVYLPLEYCDYRLGGSLLSTVTGMGGTVAPDLMDPDYFMDVFEVVREMIEDGIPLSAGTVGRGGLMLALERMCTGTGAGINVYDLMRAAGEQDVVRTLFAEVPGVILQIKDPDFDYIDAEFTLQDVAFYPLGHPEPGRRGVRAVTSEGGGIQSILEALIRSQSSEGED